MSRIIIVSLVALSLLAFDIGCVSTSQERGDASNPEHAVSQRMTLQSDGSWLINQLREGDAQLKEQLKEGDSNVKELLTEGDVRLKEQLVEDTARVKGLLNEEIDRLKKRLVEDVERVKEELKEGDNWMREQITRAESHMTEELTRETTQMKKQLQGQQEAIEDFQKSMTGMAKRNQAAMEQLTEKVTALTEQLQSINGKMSGVTDKMSALEDKLQSTSGKMSGVTDKVSALEDKLQSSNDKVTAQDTATHTGQGGTQLSQLPYTVNSTKGSTFVRWGRTTCPDNAVLVYSGIAGGGYYGYPGSGANRLCLTMKPQYDNVTLPSNRDWIYGAEYDGISGHENWDVPCALCRAPHSTTIMVPATLTCPPGWALQYTGHLAGHDYSMAAATEFVCLDAQVENRPGSSNDQNGNLYFYTATSCGSLPCPPYVDRKVATCVVCSL